MEYWRPNVKQTCPEREGARVYQVFVPSWESCALADQRRARSPAQGGRCLKTASRGTAYPCGVWVQYREGQGLLK